VQALYVVCRYQPAHDSARGPLRADLLAPQARHHRPDL